MFDVDKHGRLTSTGTIVQLTETVFASVDKHGITSFVRVQDGNNPEPDIEQLNACVSTIMGHDSVTRLLDHLNQRPA
ncbi:hypothetical protein ACV1DV_21850 [Aeromonas veronii]